MRKLKTTKSEYCETFHFFQVQKITSGYRNSLLHIYLLVDIAFMFVIAKKIYYDITI